MLTLTRRDGEGVLVDGATEVVVLSSSRGTTRLGFRAPPDVVIVRLELVEDRPSPPRRWLASEVAAALRGLGFDEAAAAVATWR